MNRQPYPEVAEAANPCIADAPKLGGEPSLEWFLKREPLVRRLVGICEDNARPGGGIEAAWRELTSWEMDGFEDHRKRIPKETEATEQASPSEPVEARECFPALTACEKCGGPDVNAEGPGPHLCLMCVGDSSDPIETRLAADGGNATRPGDDWPSVKAIDHALGVVNAICANGAPEYAWVIACNLGAEVRRLREERDLFAEAGRAAELRIVELREQVALMGAALKQQDEEIKLLRAKVQLDGDVHVVLAKRIHAAEAKLARVEALPAKFEQRQTELNNARMDFCALDAADMIRDALRDEPQPEREPKLPFNGY